MFLALRVRTATESRGSNPNDKIDTDVLLDLGSIPAAGSMKYET